MIRLSIALALLASTASAEEKAPTCMDRNEFIAMFDRDFDQRQTMRAIARNGNMIEFYVSPVGDWTMVYVEPTTGPLVACYLAEGINFKVIAQGDPT